MSITLDGKLVSEMVKNEVKLVIDAEKRKVELAVIQIGNNQASNVYIKNKERACEFVGIKTRTIKLPSDTTQAELVRLIKELNDDKNVNGILVQLPLPEHIDEESVLNVIHPNKDVDGFTYINRGKLLSGSADLVPCTPAGIIKLLDYYHVETEGKNVVVVGRSNIVGKPIAEILNQRNATVTICHSKTPEWKLGEFLSNADIIVSAVGKPNFIDQTMFGGFVEAIVDVGINRDESGKLCGDFVKNAYNYSKYHTPVPGGVGPMTVAMLTYNCLVAHKIQND